MTRKRTSTAIRFEPDLHAALVEAAEARRVSVNFLVNEALRFALPRMNPAENVKWFVSDRKEDET